jgi:hypothetical protein
MPLADDGFHRLLDPSKCKQAQRLGQNLISGTYLANVYPAGNLPRVKKWYDS